MAYFTKFGFATANVWEPNTLHNILAEVQNNEVKRIILFCQAEWCHWNFDSFTQLIEYASKKNICVDIVNGSVAINVTTPLVEHYNLHFFPESFIFKSAHQIKHFVKDRHLNLEQIEYKHHFVSLNSRAHQHRMEMMDILALHDIISNNAITWHNLQPFPYNYKFWNPTRLNLSDNFYLDPKFGNCYNLPNEYYTSFAQLVIESTVEAVFITEKTTLPLFMGKPFLVASCEHFYDHLKHLGFETYDEIFDYSFDKEPNQTMRFSMIADNFRKLSKLPLSELNNLGLLVKDKVEHNKSLVNKLARDVNRYPQPIKDIIEIYKTSGEMLDSLTINEYNNHKKIVDEFDL